MNLLFSTSRLRVLFALTFTVFVSTTPVASGAGWGDKLRSVFGQAATSEEAGAVFNNTAELGQALREALAVSAERALTQLGQKGGFADSEVFRIPLPKTVERLRKPLSLVKQDYLLDNFEDTLNLAAEEGVAAAPSIVKNAIQELTMEDLNQLWKGESDAITRFLEQRSRGQLAERMKPLISNATDATGATRSYKQLQSSLPKSGGGLFSAVRSLTGVGAASDFDLDSYVNEKALDGLFTAMAVEEKALRENPLARSTDLLKKLFGN